MCRLTSKLLFYIASLLVFQSCNLSSIYDESITIDKSSWYKDEMAKFEVAITDTHQSYNFYLNIRNTTDYRYSNLYIFLITKFPNDNISRDTIECVLADFEGKWLGKGWGGVKENSILLSSEMRFPLKGNYVFSIQHAMRNDTLKGIKNIGIRVATTD